MGKETQEKQICGYLITTNRHAKVYVPAASAPALEAAFRARYKCIDDMTEHTTRKEWDRAKQASTAAHDALITAATAHLYYGTADWVEGVIDPSGLDPSKLAAAKPAGEPHVDPIRIVKGDSIYKWVGWEKGYLYDVGTRVDGSLFNPHRYPEANVRAAIAAAEERRHQRRSKAAKAAAEARADRQELRVMEAAKRYVDGRGIGQRSHCFICRKHLTDPESIQRGIGPECWQELLKEITAIKARRAQALPARTQHASPTA